MFKTNKQKTKQKATATFSSENIIFFVDSTNRFLILLLWILFCCFVQGLKKNQVVLNRSLLQSFKNE